ncbi:MAG: NUDIX domain-containing protein [Deltaproteobacteria bacterium]|nr:NUDIX domain-containing protein [Deltaproteobacteria bacterium]
MKNSHCSYCGHKFEVPSGWPRQCRGCGQISYKNPLPVSVVLLPINRGLLVVRRDIDPGKGLLALPGGFIDSCETWQQAGKRELLEETGIEIRAEEIRLYDVISAPDDAIIIFGLARKRSVEDLPAFRRTEEASEIGIIERPVALAFSTHSQVVERYFRTQDPDDPSP